MEKDPQNPFMIVTRSASRKFLMNRDVEKFVIRETKQRLRNDAPNKTKMTLGDVILLKRNSILHVVTLTSIGLRWLSFTHRGRRTRKLKVVV